MNKKKKPLTSKWPNQVAFIKRNPDILSKRASCYYACYKYTRDLKCLHHTVSDPTCTLCLCLEKCKSIKIKNRNK